MLLRWCTNPCSVLLLPLTVVQKVLLDIEKRDPNQGEFLQVRVWLP